MDEISNRNLNLIIFLPSKVLIKQNLLMGISIFLCIQTEHDYHFVYCCLNHLIQCSQMFIRISHMAGNKVSVHSTPDLLMSLSTVSLIIIA